MSLLKAARDCLRRSDHYNALNAFIHRRDASIIEAAAAAADARWSAGKQLSPLDGRLIAIKDNICTTDLPTTCASRALDNFGSPYDATIVKKLRVAGAIVAGKTNLDEFGMGSHSTNSVFGPVRQYTGGGAEAESVSAGGSSGGSGVAVQTGQCWAAIGTDTGGSIRLPAAYTGCIGFKPSYGIVSRYGVVPYANSLDTVGVFGSHDSVQAVFDAIKGHDSRDPTSLSENLRGRLATAKAERSKRSSFRIGVPLEYNTAELDPIVCKVWQQALLRLAQNGHELVPVSLPATKYALPAYYILAPAEASSNLAKYDGVRYGRPASSTRQEDNVLFATGRGENLGEEVRRRILLGSFTLSASAIDNYFIQAQRVRKLVQQDFDRAFAKPNPLYDDAVGATAGVDFLLAPTAPSLPPELSELASRNPLHSYRDDVLTVPASLAGLPAISLPTKHGVDGHREDQGSIGLQLIAQFGDDQFVLEAARQIHASIL